jgi:hypothetical protein
MRKHDAHILRRHPVAPEVEGAAGPITIQKSIDWL